MAAARQAVHQAQQCHGLWLSSWPGSAHAFLCDNNLTIHINIYTLLIPIYNSLYFNQNSLLKTENIDLRKLNNLNFETVNSKKFPLIKVLSKLPNKDSLFETVLVANNDEFVKLYLNNRIKFNELSKKIFKFLNSHEFVKYKFIKPKKIETIEKLNQYVRLKINKLSV